MKEKKLTCILLVTILFLSISTAMASVSAQTQLPKLFVEPQTYTATQLGEYFTININITNVYNLTSVEFNLSYNTTLLNALQIVKGSFPQPPSTLTYIIRNPKGYLWLRLLCSPTEGNGTLVTILFRVTYEGSVSCTLHLYDTHLGDITGTPIPHEVQDGNYEFAIPSITVATDKPFYGAEENVSICGNLTLNNSPLEELVALEVLDPHKTIVVRTLQTGLTPPPENIVIVDMFQSDLWGDPSNISVQKGQYVYFNVPVRNIGTESKDVTVTINAYDSNMVPLPSIKSTTIPLIPGTEGGFVAGILIPDWASNGTGKAYASALTLMPNRGGVPYCPEKNATFNIGSVQGAGSGAQSSGYPGSYNLTFKLANNTKPGIYRVCATSFYQGRTLTSSAVFGVNAIYVGANPYFTIQEAVDAAIPTNNSILVLSGTYNEHVTINKSVTLVGIEPSKTIINGTGTGTVVTVTANNVTISRFTIQNSGGSFPDSGIILNNSSSCSLRENIILNNDNGVYLANSSQANIIRDNTLSKNGYGINIHSSNNNDILGNTLSNNNYGICLNQSSYTTLEDNTLIGNKYNFGVFGDSMLDFIHSVYPSNTVDGKPMYYWVNEYDKTVPNDAGYVAIINSANITVRGLTLTNNGHGVLFAYTTNSLIERVNAITNDYGIYLDFSHNNTIIGSTVSNNTIGIHQRYCNNNIICHNNFTDNTNQTNLYQSSNTWNDGAGKGNYWSDYTGNDTNTDGVGDTLLPHQGVDWYPLTNPWIRVHDVAIINVTYKSPWPHPQVYPTGEINVTVTVKIKGDFTENFTITARYDENHIQTKTVTGLTPLEETTKNLTWILTGVPSGNYSLSAEASELVNEVNTTDNVFVDDQVIVRLWGDVTGDGEVTSTDATILNSLLTKIMLDVMTMEEALADRPFADVNGDGKITSTDVSILNSILTKIMLGLPWQ